MSDQDDDDDFDVPGLPKRRRAPRPAEPSDEPEASGESVAPVGRPPVGRAIVASIVTSVIVSVATVFAMSHRGIASWRPASSHAASAPIAANVREEPFRLPDFVRVPQTNAQAFADALHVGLRVRERRPDPDLAADVVASQSPAAGAFVRRGDTIEVVVSSGPPVAVAPVVADASVTDATAVAAAMVHVPRLTGMGVSSAQGLLAPLGLRVGRRRESFDEARAAHVILRQSPSPDASVPGGTAVDIVVNTGVPPGGEEH